MILGSSICAVHVFNDLRRLPSDLAERLRGPDSIAASPLVGTAGMALLPAGGQRLLLATRTEAGWTAAVSCDVLPSKLPGCRVLRIDRLSADLPPSTLTALLEAIGSTARGLPLLRRVIVTATGAPDRVQALHAMMESLGFEEPPAPSVPRRTLVIDLEQPTEVLLRQADSSLTRALRRLAEMPVEFRPLRDPGLAPRMAELLSFSFSRERDGLRRVLPLEGMIRTSVAHPDEASLIGCFLRDRAAPESLIAWEYCVRRNEWASSEYAGMERTKLDGTTIPAGYGTLWHSVLWAAGRGVRRFDLGGFTRPGDPEHATFATISRFKSHFPGTDIVGRQREWHLVPSTALARTLNLGERLTASLRP